MTKPLFRLVLIVPAVATILGVWIILFSDKADWPEAAHQYIAWYVAQPLTPYEFWRSRISLVALLGMVGSTVGVVLFWPRARYVYLASVVIAVLSEVPDTPVLIGGWEPLLDNIAKIFVGLALALMFSEPVATWFSEKRKAAR